MFSFTQFNGYRVTFVFRWQFVLQNVMYPAASITMVTPGVLHFFVSFTPCRRKKPVIYPNLLGDCLKNSHQDGNPKFLRVLKDLQETKQKKGRHFGCSQNFYGFARIAPVF